jgi:hypothetical protein
VLFLTFCERSFTSRPAMTILGIIASFFQALEERCEVSLSSTVNYGKFILFRISRLGAESEVMTLQRSLDLCIELF